MFSLEEIPEIMLNDEQVLIRRRDATLGQNTIVVDGVRRHRGFEAEFELSCNIQPVSGRERMDEFAGQRFDEQYWCFIADSEQPTQVDDLVYRQADNLWYVAFDCENWGSYTKLRIRQMDVGELTPAGLDPLEVFRKRQFVSDSQTS